jgi:hypothetical protein
VGAAERNRPSVRGQITRACHFGGQSAALVSSEETRSAGDARASGPSTRGRRGCGRRGWIGRTAAGSGVCVELNRAGWAASARGPKGNLESGCRWWHGITNWPNSNRRDWMAGAPALLSRGKGFLDGPLTCGTRLRRQLSGPSCRCLSSWRRSRCAGAVKLDSCCPWHRAARGGRSRS